MEKISVADVIKFLRKGDRSRITFIANLKKPKVKSDNETGGNYWISSTSSISQVFKSEELSVLDDKIEVLIEKKQNASANLSKDMFQKNIDLLHNAKEFDYSELKPYFEIVYLKNTREIREFNTVPIQIIPNHVFKFKDHGNGVDKIGAIWIVAKKGGYRQEELAIFVYSLYEYLTYVHSKNYEISADYCIALDITTSRKLNYTQVKNFGHINFVQETIILLKNML